MSCILNSWASGRPTQGGRVQGHDQGCPKECFNAHGGAAEHHGRLAGRRLPSISRVEIVLATEALDKLAHPLPQRTSMLLLFELGPYVTHVDGL